MHSISFFLSYQWGVVLAPWHSANNDGVQTRIQVSGLPNLCPVLNFLLTVKASEKRHCTKRKWSLTAQANVVGQSSEQPGVWSQPAGILSSIL